MVLRFSRRRLPDASVNESIPSHFGGLARLRAGHETALADELRGDNGEAQGR